jgi:hypothetical protein
LGLGFLFGKCAVANSPPLNERKAKSPPKGDLSPGKVRRGRFFSRSSNNDEGTSTKSSLLNSEEEPLKKIVSLDEIIQRASESKQPVMKGMMSTVYLVIRFSLLDCRQRKQLCYYVGYVVPTTTVS